MFPKYRMRVALLSLSNKSNGKVATRQEYPLGAADLGPSDIFRLALLRGIVFVILKQGADRIFELSGVARQRFRTEVLYPDELFQALLRASIAFYGVDDATAQEAFSEYFMEVSPKMFPAIYNKAGNARALFEMVPVIHKQWPSAASAAKFRQKLWIETSSEERLVFKYASPNRLCGVLHHVAERVLTYYEEEGEVREIECVNRGTTSCRIGVLFSHPSPKQPIRS